MRKKSLKKQETLVGISTPWQNKTLFYHGARMYYSFEISHATLNEWKEESYAFALIDVREKEEREQGHMGGESIPLSELIERVDELPKKTPIVFYCRSGARSLLAARKLRDVLGRADIYTLAGGILALQKQPS